MDLHNTKTVRLKMELFNVCLSYALSTLPSCCTFYYRSHIHVVSQGDFLPGLDTLAHGTQTQTSVQMWPGSVGKGQTCLDALSGVASDAPFYCSSYGTVYTCTRTLMKGECTCRPSTHTCHQQCNHSDHT